MQGKFREWIGRNRLTEGRGFPLRKLRDVEKDTNNLLVCCDHLQDQGYDSKQVNIKNMAYIKPLSNAIDRVFSERFPTFIIMRRKGGAMPSPVFYTLYNRDLLESAFDFLHISKTQHIIDDLMFNPYDCCRNVSEEEIQNAARTALSTHPEEFSGKLTGPGAVGRARPDPDLWDYWKHVRVLQEILPHEDMYRGTVFNAAGLVRVFDLVAQIIKQKWGVEVQGQYMIDRRI